MDTAGEGEGGTNGESNMETYTLLLSHFSRVRLLATPWTAAYQAPPSMGFSGQTIGVGCHCLLRLDAIYIYMR